MSSDECRAKDPSTCRHHGRSTGVVAKMKDAIQKRSFSDYADCREELEKEAPPLPKVKGITMFSQKDAENAFLADHGGEWSIRGMPDSIRRIKIRQQFARLDKAAPYMGEGFATPEAVEEYAKEHARQEGRDWDNESEVEQDIGRVAARHVLFHTLRQMN